MEANHRNFFGVAVSLKKEKWSTVYMAVNNLLPEFTSLHSFLDKFMITRTQFLLFELRFFQKRVPKLWQLKLVQNDKLSKKRTTEGGMPYALKAFR